MYQRRTAAHSLPSHEADLSYIFTSVHVSRSGKRHDSRTHGVYLLPPLHRSNIGQIDSETDPTRGRKTVTQTPQIRLTSEKETVCHVSYDSSIEIQEQRSRRMSVTYVVYAPVPLARCPGEKGKARRPGALHDIFLYEEVNSVAVLVLTRGSCELQVTQSKRGPNE